MGFFKWRKYHQKYLVRNPLLFFYLCCVDVFWTKKEEPPLPKKPTRILICNIAHLGDVVISTCFLRWIKSLFPDAEIGFLCGSWSASLLKGHPSINQLHSFDHWKLNRKKVSFFRKYLRHLKTFSRSKREIRKASYDISIDLYHFFPNAIYLLYRAGIRIRVGYTSGGYGSLLTHAHLFSREKKYLAAKHRELFSKVFNDLDVKRALHPDLSMAMDAHQKKRQERYAVIHMGAGHPSKIWPSSSWKEIAQALSKKYEKIYFTGKGKEEQEQINKAMSGSPQCESLCSKLNFQQLFLVLENASLIISSDSLPAHLSSCMNTPTVIISIGNYCAEEWFYKTQKRKLLVQRDSIKEKKEALIKYTRNITPDCVMEVIDW